MRKILFILLCFPQLSLAEVFSGSGDIVDILVRKSMNTHAVLYVENFKSAGSCKTYNGLVTIAIDKGESADAFYSMALAAYMSQKDIKIVVDDTEKNSDGLCSAQDLRMNARF